MFESRASVLTPGEILQSLAAQHHPIMAIKKLELGGGGAYL